MIKGTNIKDGGYYYEKTSSYSCKRIINYLPLSSPAKLIPFRDHVFHINK